MSIAKILEITAESNQSFDDAIRQGVKQAGQTVRNIRSAWIAEQQVTVNNDQVVTYRVHMKVTFVVE